MLSVSPGHSPDYFLTAVATGRENYYTGAVAAGEPPGRWYGRGAEALGLAGEAVSGIEFAHWLHNVLRSASPILPRRTPLPETLASEGRTCW